MTERIQGFWREGFISLVVAVLASMVTYGICSRNSMSRDEVDELVTAKSPYLADRALLVQTNTEVAVRLRTIDEHVRALELQMAANAGKKR